MDVWEVPYSSFSGLDRDFVMDVGPKPYSVLNRKVTNSGSVPLPRRAILALPFELRHEREEAPRVVLHNSA